MYIGITSQEVQKRWLNGNGYIKCPLFFNAITKYGWSNITHEILLTNLNKDEAEQKEIELIKTHKSNQRKHGYNLANGGNCKGKHSEETKRKISLKSAGRKQSKETIEKRVVRGEKHYLYGKQMCEKTKEKLREASIGRKVKEETKSKISKTMSGRRQTEEHKLNAAKTHYVPIYQYNTSGNLIREWESITAACKHINKSHSNIVKCCKGEVKTAYGYIWKYKEQIINTPVKEGQE